MERLPRGPRERVPSSVVIHVSRPVGGAAPAQGPSPLWPGPATPIQRQGDAAATVGLAHSTPSLYIHREREAELYSKFFFWAPVSFFPSFLGAFTSGGQGGGQRAHLFRGVCARGGAHLSKMMLGLCRVFYF